MTTPRATSPAPTASRTGMTRLRRRAVTAVSVAGLAALAVGGAAAADDAKPGDALYGVDRVLESVGVNDGGTEERLDETAALVDEGELDLAVETADEALEDMTDLDDEAAEDLGGLLHAAESVLSGGSEQSLERRTQVAEMLTFMATTELKGKEFGQAVSQHARGTWVDESEGTDDAEGADDAVDEETEPPAGVEAADDAEGLTEDDADATEDVTKAAEKAAAKAQKAEDKAAKTLDKAEAKAVTTMEKAAKKVAKAEAKATKKP